jgi:hypothetical protein
MGRVQSPWRLAARRLERAIAAPTVGHERPWANRLGDAAADLEQVLHRHTWDMDLPGGFQSAVDLTRPSFVRQIDRLRRELTDLLALAGRLEEEARSAAQAFSFPDRGRPGGTAGIPEFGRLRGQGQDLLQAVERFQAEETALVLESVTTDIGVGD